MCRTAAVPRRSNSASGDVQREYGFDQFWSGDHTTFEIVAEPVARLDPTSAIHMERATISVLLASGLSTESFQLAVRNANRGEDSRRRTVGGCEFAWTDLANLRRGTFTFEVGSGTVAERRALYAGQVQDIRQLADPSSLPNPRRLIVELNDPGLAKMIEVLTTIKERDDKRRNDFEAGVAVLFYMLGFETVRIGGNRKTTDGPDIYAITANGELLVIECTSGAFSEENVGKLLTRAKSQRARFSRSPIQPHRQVSAVIVTPRTAAELGPQLAAAEKQGVLVLCRPEVLDAIERTQFTPDADSMLKAWRQASTLRFLANPSWN